MIQIDFIRFHKGNYALQPIPQTPAGFKRQFPQHEKPPYPWIPCYQEPITRDPLFLFFIAF